MNSKNRIENLRILAKSDSRALRAFMTLQLLADALGPWEQGARAFVGLLLRPVVGAHLDDELLLSTCQRLPGPGRRLLARMPQLCDLSSPVFFRVLAMIEKAVASHGNSRDYEALARMCLLFVQRQRRPFKPSERRAFQFVRAIPTKGPVEKNIFVICMQIVLGVDRQKHIRRLLRVRRSQHVTDVLADTLLMDFDGRDSLLHIIEHHKHGVRVKARLAMFRKTHGLPDFGAAVGVSAL